MMMKATCCALGLLGALLLLCAAPAAADPISVTTDGTATTGADGFAAADNNDFLYTGSVDGTNGITGRWGGNLTLSGGKVTIVASFIDKEAGYTNKFWVDTNDDGVYEELFSTATSARGAMTTFTLDVNDLANGIIPFKFTTSGTYISDSDGAVYNGENTDDSPTNGPAVDDKGTATTSDDEHFLNFVVVNIEAGKTLTMKNGYVLTDGWYLFLDDTGGGDDDNHDDMIVRLVAVPEPSAIVLFGFAALGLVFFTRRRARLRASA